jgi:apolipoprotein N-acyltransferase
VSLRRQWRLFAAGASGAVLAAARPPLDLGLLALVALVPLFVAWRNGSIRQRAGLAFVAGLVYYGVVLSWSWYFGAIAIVPFVAVMAGYWAAAGAAIGWFARRDLRSPWLTAAVWVLAEAVVARFPLDGFSWGDAGYALHNFALARDVASVGGVALVSFLVVAANALLADLVVRPAPVVVMRALAGMLLVATVSAAAPVVQPEMDDNRLLRVAILQGNDKNRDLTAEEHDARYLPNSHFGLVDHVDDPVDLIIFPESSMDEDPRTDRYLGERLARFARDRNAWVLANAVADAPENPEENALNLNVLYGPDGEVEGTYAKRHLVPFGERVPLSDTMRAIIPILDDEVPRDFLPGRDAGIFDVAGVPVATVICFESAFGYEVRPLVRDGAEVIVVSTNNRSYRRSANSAQHVAISQMRAAETGRPVVQAAISGISAVIDADGRLVADTALFDRTVLQRTVVATSGQTLYVRFGEWVVLGSTLALMGCLVADIVRARRRSVDSVPEEQSPQLTPAGDRV